jgi:hypothetical protein
MPDVAPIFVSYKRGGTEAPGEAGASCRGRKGLAPLHGRPPAPPRERERERERESLRERTPDLAAGE